MKSFSRVDILFVFLFSLLFLNELNGQDFEVAPVRLEFNAEPGDNQIRVITIKNHSNVKTSFIVALGDFMPTSSGEKKAMAPNSMKRSCANWININPSFFELNPGDDIQLQVGMMVPNDQFGGTWCMLYIQPTREQTSWAADKALGAGVMISGRIGVQVYQSPKSNANYSLKISNLVEVGRTARNERKFNATIENLGEKITVCRSYLIASNMQTAEEKQFPAKEFETFPKMSRTIELILPNELASGRYALAAILDYGSKYALEGTQIIIDIGDKEHKIDLDVKQDSIKQ